MAGNRGKSKGQRDAQELMNDGLQSAPPRQGTVCPISSPSQGNLAVPFQNSFVGDAEKHKSVEGGPSICRDGDTSPLLFSCSGVSPLQAAPSHKQAEAALKVFVESPNRKSPSVKLLSSGLAADLRWSELKVSDESPNSEMPAVKSVPNGLGAEQRCSEPPKTRPLRSYADGVSNVKETEADSKSKTSSAGLRVKFGEVKSSLNKSFHGDGGTNTFGQILEIDGRKVVTFSVEELDELAAPFEFTLVGKFSHGFPTMRTLKSIMGNLNLKGRFSVSLLEHKHVLFRFSCEEDYTRLWSRQVWFMAGFPMRVLKWTPDFDPLVEAPFAPVWVLFLYLPVHLFDQRSLFQIASALGKPLRMDSAKAELTRASTARVCIEIDVTKARLPEVELRLGGKIKMQEVEYENVPSYCSFCKHLGHDLKDCKSFPSASALGENSLARPLNGVEVSVMAQKQPSRQVSPPPPNPELPPPFSPDLFDSVSIDSKGILSFTPASNTPTIKPVNLSEIRDDILKSYDQFDDLTDSESVCISLHHFVTVANGDKNCFSDGDCNPNSEPIILPTKKKTKKKSKNNSVIVQERVDPQIIGTTEEVEGYIEVVSKNKKKKGKEKKNPG